jgi:hypothetical protein
MKEYIFAIVGMVLIFIGAYCIGHKDGSKDGYHEGYKQGFYFGKEEKIDEEIDRIVQERWEYINAKVDSTARAELKGKALDAILNFPWSE